MVGAVVKPTDRSAVPESSSVRRPMTEAPPGCRGMGSAVSRVVRPPAPICSRKNFVGASLMFFPPSRYVTAHGPATRTKVRPLPAPAAATNVRYGLGGMTRASVSLSLTYALSYYEGRTEAEPSRFIRELRDDLPDLLSELDADPAVRVIVNAGARGIVRGRGPVKCLADGTLGHALTVRLQAFSARAREQIAAAGGSVEVVRV